MTHQDTKTPKLLLMLLQYSETSLSRRDSSMPNSGKQIYPKDCYEFLLGLCSKTGLSFYKVVNIVIREGIIRLKEKHKVEELIFLKL